MKLVKKFVLAVLFVSAVAFTAHAGEMETPGYATPPPSHSTATTGTSEVTTSNSTLDLESGEYASSPSDEIFYDALTAILSVF